jgi:hypothetical protein
MKPSLIPSILWGLRFPLGVHIEHSAGSTATIFTLGFTFLMLQEQHLSEFHPFLFPSQSINLITCLRAAFSAA